MSVSDPPESDWSNQIDDDDSTCWQCFGDGGWASCFEDCCPYEGGEEMCDDPACWRKCDICRGKGVIPVEDRA